MFKTLITIMVSLLFVSQSFALASTRPEEHFGEAVRVNCSSMVECHKMQSINTGNLAPVGEILLVNIYDLGGK